MSSVSGYVRFIIGVGMFTFAGSLGAVPPVNKAAPGGLAVKGYDPVAYFTLRKPTRGKRRITLKWKGALWRFSSARNRALFRKSPYKYAPRYGGYCAWAVSQGYTAPIDPRAWSIVKGRLYLNYNRAVRKQWEANKRNLIRKANVNWPKLLKK